ncbi:hypothetical protein KO02_15590 [Sphingobacterium sp. ML3W]|uniref:RagB/SusD family nutrient uptake outer membrane protein n=1 Tax=Sphingobacterium sp. ML3W TaxID=1538644 RepID=UPI0004F6C39B|nr:RagB/SusD family nutrient uptake outer membrane protein [Sphingobacterium sp. ML3W]AIM37955.1 hypothetical protein KO02_15590 [Sphingobacterium sp. ML3W]
MKNNKITYISSTLLLIALSLSSCKDVLDTQPYDKIGEEVVWTNRANAETFIFSTYSIMENFNSGPATDAWTMNLISMDGTYNGAANVFNERLDRTSDMGFNNWASVRRCNLIIQNVGASAGISEEDKIELIAEAKFLRAMSYYHVARRIGRIVWIDKVLNPEDELLLSATKSPTESYAYIIKDLEEAVEGLPADKVSGRANKYVAAAMLTEVCLQALAYEGYPQTLTVAPSNPLLSKVIEYGELVKSGGYQLQADYGAMFNDSDPNSNETIFAVYRKAINTSCASTPMQVMIPNLNNDNIKLSGGSPLLKSPIRIFEAWGDHGPSMDFTDDYLVIDQQDPQKAVRWNETSQYKKAVDEQASIAPTLIPKANGESEVKRGSIKSGQTETIWSLTNAARDARWNASILSDSSAVFYGETLTTDVKGNSGRWLKLNGHAYNTSLTNMYWRKGVYNNVNPRIYAGVPTDYHYVTTRLGRVYLNMAEAYLLQQNLPKAIELLNQTRVTHGQLPPAKMSDLATAWTDYKRERRVDLVLENDYYWSLLRWGRYGGNANHGVPSGGTIPELTTLPQVMDVSKDRKHYSVVSGAFFSSNNVREFDSSRRYLFPIAQSYLDRNPNFGIQNPGW